MDSIIIKYFFEMLPSITWWMHWWYIFLFNNTRNLFPSYYFLIFLSILLRCFGYWLLCFIGIISHFLFVIKKNIKSGIKNYKLNAFLRTNTLKIYLYLFKII